MGLTLGEGVQSVQDQFIDHLKKKQRSKRYDRDAALDQVIRQVMS